jgi:2'-5' RNA ligase
MTPDTPQQRVFFALWPDEAVREGLSRLARRLNGDGRPVPAEHLHLTLAFPGTVPSGVVSRLIARMRSVEVPAIRLRLDALGHFARPRIAWVGPSEVPEALAELSSALNGICAEVGVRMELRSFRPHVSLRRGVTRFQPACVAPLDWLADRIVLVESGQGGHPGPYRILASHPDPIE